MTVRDYVRWVVVYVSAWGCLQCGVRSDVTHDPVWLECFLGICSLVELPLPNNVCILHRNEHTNEAGHQSSEVHLLRVERNDAGQRVVLT